MNANDLVCNQCENEKGKHEDCARCDIDSAARAVQEEWLFKNVLVFNGVNVAPALGHAMRSVAIENFRRNENEAENSL